MEKSINWNRFEKTIGGLKFAVILISLFTFSMIVGTFLESYYGTEFANRTVYKTIPFMSLQFLMFMSILFATFTRLPPKKSLYGFYTIHSGLIILFCGSFITWYAGVDGNITLVQGDPSRTIELPQNQIKITVSEDSKVITRDLPDNAFTTSINETYQNFKIKDYLPYSENSLKWLPTAHEGSTSSKYLIYNENISQDFVLSNNPRAIDFESTTQMGLLTVHYLPKELGPCFAKNNPSKIVFWNSANKTCFTPEERNLAIKKTSKGNRFIVYKEKGKIYSFFPDFSPYAFGSDLQVLETSPVKIFNKTFFEKKPNLFLFGNHVSFIEDDEWSYTKIAPKKAIELPWMGFQLELLRHESNFLPTYVPHYTLPGQQNGKLIKGAQKAVSVEIEGKEYWITDQRPLSMLVDGKRTNIELTNTSLRLPFEFILTNFKMDTDPGTKNPASYESFVNLFTNKGSKGHHIYMNNPLKYRRFTFYQASYFKDNNGGYGSVLSANIDPGRPWKYFGSILLVFGAIWHYYLRRKKKKKLNTNQDNNFKLKNAFSGGPLS